MSGAELSIELLEQLARKGEIDPWDVDVVDAMDRCLADLDVTDSQDLRLCGRTLHCATILLRLKAEAMAAEVDEILAPPPVASDDDDWFSFDEPPEDDDDGEGRIAGQVLDLALIRRANARQPRRRHVTLAELVSELRRMERETAAAAPKFNAVRRARNAEIQARTVGLAHEEDIEGDARRLAEHLSMRFQTEPLISFARLAAVRADDRGLFLAVMFLAHWGVLELQQAAPYGDFTLERSTAAAPQASDDASAAA